MKFKSFLVPPVGRSNYFKGGNISISGSSTVTGGGVPVPAESETAFIYLRRHKVGQDTTLKPEEKAHNKEVYERYGGGSTKLNFYINDIGFDSMYNPVEWFWNSADSTIRFSYTNIDRIYKGKLFSAGDIEILSVSNPNEKVEDIMSCYIYLDSSTHSKDSNTYAYAEIIKYYYDSIYLVPVYTRKNPNDIGAKTAFQVEVIGNPVASVKFSQMSDDGKAIEMYSLTPDGVVASLGRREIGGEKSYHIKTRRDTSDTTNDTTIYTIIENIDPDIVNNPDYRMVFMLWKRGSGKTGKKWSIPMFCGEWYPTSGDWTAKHPGGIGRTSRYDWADTWWPITIEKHPSGVGFEPGVRMFNNPQSNRKVLSQMIDTKTHPNTGQFHNNNRKLKFGCAIFKNTHTTGWRRVSNIAEIQLYATSMPNPRVHVEVLQ